MGKSHYLLLLLAFVAAPVSAYQAIFNPFTSKPDYVGVSTTTSGSGIGNNFIQNSNTLQSGATFYVSSGTANNFNAINVNVTGLTSGLCVQTGTGGSLTTSGSACSSGSSGGSSSLAVTTGTAGGFTGTISSPTAIINFSSTTFTGSFQSGSTAFIQLNASSVTLQGNTQVPLLNANNVWTGQNSWTTVLPSTFTHGVLVSTLSVTNLNSNSGTVLFDVGSNQQFDQFKVIDSQAVSLNVFGIRAGDLLVGNAGATEKVGTVQDSGNFLNVWNSGEIDLQTTTSGSGGKDIVLLPQEVESLRASNTKGVVITSSVTITNTRGLSVSTVTFTPSVLFASLGSPADGSMEYCSDCTVVTPASCSTNLLTSCVCAGSGTGAFARRINGAWICD